MALREINLIPEDILTKLHFRQHLYLWAACLTISLALIFGLHLYQTSVAMAQKHPFISLKDTDTDLASKIEEIKQMQKELEGLNQKQAALEAVTGNIPYSRILLKLSGLMNGDTWLTRLDIDGDRERGGVINLHLTGFSKHNEELGDFLNQLSSEPLFGAVLLKYAKEAKRSASGKEEDEEIEMINFQVDCRIQGDDG